MLIEGNGIKVMADVSGAILTFVVLSQSAEITKVIKDAGCVVNETGDWGIRSNLYPSFNKKDKKKYPSRKNFYLRGTDKTKDNNVVTCEFDSDGDAQEALFNLEDLIVNLDDYVPVETPEAAEEEENVSKKPGVKPIRKATVEGSKNAYADVVNLFKKAHDNGYLVEMWRLVTSFRSNDAAFATVAGYNTPNSKSVCCCDAGKALTGKAVDGKVVDGKSISDGKVVSGKNVTVNNGKTFSGKLVTGKMVCATGKSNGKADISVDSGKGLVVNSGICTLIRHAVLVREQAKILRLTDCNNYPETRKWTPVNKVASTGNVHADEHYGLEQGGADILNKAFS